MSQDIFSIVPIEIIQDPRLTKRQIKVLIALLSFRGKNTSTVWPSRDKLSQRCNMPVTRISQTTSELVELGWLIKEGKGGFSKSTRYQITVPDLVTVTKSVTVTKTVTPNGYQNGNGHGGYQNGNGQRTNQELTNRTKKGGKRFKPPSIDDIRAYCHERGNGVDACAFVDFYESKGWMIGKNKMKCWKSAVRTWESRQIKNKSSHVHAAILAARGIDIDTGKEFGTGLEQIEGLLN